MKTTLFTYETEVGTFWIQPEPADRVRLGIDRHKLKTYSSARMAARAVAEHETGWPAWDALEGVPGPAGLNSWKRPQPKKAPQKPDRTRTAGAHEP
jgi:hypothetical protein